MGVINFGDFAKLGWRWRGALGGRIDSGLRRNDGSGRMPAAGVGGEGEFRLAPGQAGTLGRIVGMLPMVGRFLSKRGF